MLNKRLLKRNWRKRMVHFISVTFFALASLWLAITWSPNNLVKNGSFENSESEWEFQIDPFTPPRNSHLTFKLPLSYLSTDIRFEYLAKDVSGELAKSLIYFKFFSKDRKFLGQMTYVGL